MKKLFAVLMAGLMLLCFGAATPAMAVVGESTVEWDDFRIITQPQAVTVPYGSSFTLSVEVNVPAGIEVVSYFWKENYSGGGGAGTQAVLHLSPGEPLYPEAYRPWLTASGYYYCVITAVEVDAEGDPVGSPWELYSETAAVTVLAQRDMNFFETIKNAVTDFFAGAFLWSYFGIMWFFGILMAPVYLIRDLFS